MIQDTLVLIKPDAVRRKMVGQIVTAIEHLDLSIIHLKQKNLNIKEASSLYEEYKGKWHFNRNIRHITTGPVVAVHVQGISSVQKCRDMVETIRKAHFDLIKLPANLVHATLDPEKSRQELSSINFLDTVPT